MMGIPPVSQDDVEDVAWALQTADALWKRNELLDAIVWLRRAAQAAGEASQDDRALELARQAAELSEWLSANSSEDENTSEETFPRLSPSFGSPPPATGSDAPPYSRADESTLDMPSSVRDMLEARSRRFPVVQPDPHLVPEARDRHAGLLDPWSEAVGRRSVPSDPRIDTYAAESDEVITSARHVSTELLRASREGTPREEDEEQTTPTDVSEALARQSESRRAHEVAASMDLTSLDPPKPIPKPPLRPPVAPPRPASSGRMPAASPAEARSRSSGRLPAVSPPPRHPSSPKVPAVPVEPEPPPRPAPRPQTPPPVPSEGSGPPSESLGPTSLRLSEIEFSNVEGLADFPDDERSAFLSSARPAVLVRGEELRGFALAFVVDGDVDVVPIDADIPAARLNRGSILRSRGTVEPAVAVRLVAASKRARLLSWDDQTVSRAFGSCPWVEEDLRMAADRIQAFVGASTGPLGHRFDTSLRADVLARMELVNLAPGETLVVAGQPLPGLAILGSGELVLSDARGVVRPGEFLFGELVLAGGLAPVTARAGEGGAAVLLAGRVPTQELLLTFPPLLELLSGG